MIQCRHIRPRPSINTAPLVVSTVDAAEAGVVGRKLVAPDEEVLSKDSLKKSWIDFSSK